MKAETREAMAQELPKIKAIKILVEDDFRTLKHHLKTLTRLVNRAEKYAWIDPEEERIIADLKALVVLRSASIFRSLAEVDRILAGRQAEEGSPLPSPKLVQSFQNQHMNPTPSEKIRAAHRQVEWNYWILRRHLATVIDLVKEKLQGSWQVRARNREIEQLRNLISERSAGIFNAVVAVRFAVLAHQAGLKESDKSRVLPGE